MEDMPGLLRMLGNESNFMVRFAYEPQPLPDGPVQAFIIGKEFIRSGAATLRKLRITEDKLELNSYTMRHKI